MGGSQPSGTTTTTQTTSPWAGEQGPLLNIYQMAGNIAGDVPQYYPSDTYAPLTSQQQGLMSNLINYTSGGGDAALQGANSTFSNLESPGYTSATSSTFGAANPTIASLASGSALTPMEEDFAPSAGTIANLGGGSMMDETNPNFTQSQGVLNNEMSSSYLNPWNSSSFGSMVNNTLASVLPSVSSSFINGGRTDSGLATEAETEGATNAVGNLAQQQYESDQGIQNQAAQEAASNQQMGLNSALQAAGLASQNLGTGLSSTLSATGQAGSNLLGQEGQQVQGGFFAPMIDQEQLNNLSTGLNTADISQENNQNQINANMAAYNYDQMQPWNQLGLYEGAITGTGIPGSSTTTSQPYFENTGANVMSALGGLGSLGLMAAMI